MFKNAVGRLFLVLAVLFIVVSCGKQQPTGILGAGKIQMTKTPTPTPDVNFTVYIHQEATPAASVGVTLRSIDTNGTIKAVTGLDGKAGFKVNSGGKWNLEVDTFDGFKNQTFPVEPLSNTFFAVNYGIPSLDMQLVSGSESVSLISKDNPIVYKITYHTKFERAKVIKANVPEKMVSEKMVSEIEIPQIVANDGDSLLRTLTIPNSFEDYAIDNFQCPISAECLNVSGGDTKSNVRLLTKDWSISVSADFYYSVVYAYDDNNRMVSYYAGIKNPKFTLDTPGFSTSELDKIQCVAISAGNTGTAAAKTPIVVASNCMPNYTGKGCFSALMKIPTNSNWDYVTKKTSDNGQITVRFTLNESINIERTFWTNIDWGLGCMHWCCTSAPQNGVSRDLNDPGKYVCMYNVTTDCNNCWCLLWFEKVVPADITRMRYERVTVDR